MTMHITQQKEQFSRAYVSAVAAAAGCNISDWKVDDDSIDIGFGRRSGRRARLEAQLKCTSAHTPSPERLAFPLPVKNYDDLRDPNLHVPRILVVLVVPDDVGAWVRQNHNRLVMRRCAWWTSLRNAPTTANDNTVTVHLPVANLFGAASLTGMLDLIDQGGVP